VPIMLDVLAKCFPDRLAGWEPQLRALIPSYGTPLSSDPATASKVMGETARELGIPA